MTSNMIIIIPPGETIKEQLNQQHISLGEAAKKMKMNEAEFNKFLKGEIDLTDKDAVGLERILGIPAVFWINLEKMYRQQLSEITKNDSFN